MAFVTGSALLGMALGGGFGYVAGILAPDYFVAFVSWAEFKNPIGVAVMLGSFGGIICGGFLGAFAVTVQVIGDRISDKRIPKT